MGSNEYPMRKLGSQSEVAPIKTLLLKQPKDAFVSKNNIQRQWKKLNYTACPDLVKATVEYDQFVTLLKQFQIDITFLPQHDKTGLDSIYTHDPVIISNKGAILCQMGKIERRGEPDATGEFLSNLGVPIYGTITGEGRLEGGDVVWVMIEQWQVNPVE
ncbi:MAG: hypothetical protein IID16_00460 [Candidatus Marinimicrobia bacterium]|nr:hypothetical protein [Candidatus Neomarinimicrobiota bacterium]